VPPLYFAVTVTLVEAVTAVVRTLTLNDLAPAGTTRVAGTGNAALVLESVTVAPPAGAAALRLTERFTLAPPTTLACETETEVSVGSTTGATVAAAV